MEEEDEYENGRRVEPDHDEDELVSEYIEHLRERDDNDEMMSTEAKTDHEMVDEDDSEELAIRERDQMQSENENEEWSSKERDAAQMVDEDGSEELSIKGIDPDQMTGEDEDGDLSKERGADQLEDGEEGEDLSKERGAHKIEDDEDFSLKETATYQIEDEEEGEELSKEIDAERIGDENDSEQLSSGKKVADQIEDDEDLSLKETDTYRMEDGEEMLTTEFDSDLNKSDTLPSMADSEQSDTLNDVSDNHATQSANQYIKPSIKKERHIADALPNDIDLLADYESETSESRDATKLTWSAFKIAYLISAPLTIIGLALLIMGALNIPETFNLLTIGVPVFIIAGLVFAGSTVYLCCYKAKKMRLFEFGGDVEGEIAGVGNMGYAQDEERAPPKVTYGDDEQTPL